MPRRSPRKNAVRDEPGEEEAQVVVQPPAEVAGASDPGAGASAELPSLAPARQR